MSTGHRLEAGGKEGIPLPHADSAGVLSCFSFCWAATGLALLVPDSINISLCVCYGLNCVPPPPPPPDAEVVTMGVFREVVSENEMIRMGPNPG